MPYVITTRTFSDPGVQSIWQHTRTAVATLEEAIDTTARMLDELPFDPNLLNAADALPAEGGTIGPLPDGTVIEVHPA